MEDRMRTLLSREFIMSRNLLVAVATLGEMRDYQNAIWLGALVAAVLVILIIFDFLPLPP
jgi:hypothetical protein